VTPPPVVISSRNDVKKKSWWGGHTPGHVGARWCLVKMYALETIPVWDNTIVLVKNHTARGP
jgi:hypothetical protein